MAHDRSQINDPTVAISFHARDESPAHEEDARDVGVHDLAPFIEGELGDLFAEVDAGVVDEDVWIAKFFGHACFQSAHLLFIRHVSLENVGVGPDLSDSSGGCFQLFEVAGDQGEFGAGFGQREGHRSAESLAGAGDEGDSPL